MVENVNIDPKLDSFVQVLELYDALDNSTNGVRVTKTKAWQVVFSSRPSLRQFEPLFTIASNKSNRIRVASLIDSNRYMLLSW
jgi:hypothetical protein